MRIGLNLLFLLPGVVGGTETYAVSLIEALARIDERNEYYVFTNRESLALVLPTSPCVHRVPCPISATSRFARYVWEQVHLPRLVRSLQLDLLHSLGYVQPLFVPTRSVVTIHDLNFHNLREHLPLKKRLALRFFVSQGAKRADHVLTVSEFSRNQIVEVLKVAPQKVTVTYNAPKGRAPGVVSREGLAARYGVRSPYIMGLSSLSPHKNMPNLIRAFAHLKERGFADLQLLLAGHRPSGDSWGDTGLGDLKAGSEVIFTGHVPDPVLASLYTHAALFVFPSLYEGFGIPVLEAFSYGVPVVCSSAAALPEVAGDAAVLFDPHDPRAMADAIATVLTDGVLARDLLERGRERVKLFGWDITARKTLEVYDMLAHSRATRRHGRRSTER